MIEIIVALADGATIYVPAPCKGNVAKMTAVFQADTVVANDTIKASRGNDVVNTLTAVTEAGLVVETGVPDTTNKGLIFDPTSATAANQVIKLVSGSEGGSAAAIVTIFFDDSAYVAQAAKEA